MQAATQHRLGTEADPRLSTTATSGTCSAAPATSMPRRASHQRLGLRRRPDHVARAVDQRNDGQPERVAQLQEAGGLVGRGRRDGARHHHAVVRDDTDRAAVDPRQRGHHLGRETWPQERHRPLVGQRLDDRGDRIGAPGALGNHCAQAVFGRRRRRARSRPGSSRAAVWSPRRPRPHRRRRRRPRRWALASRSGRPRRRWTSPSPPPAIIAGPPMPIEASSVATIRSEQPAMTALPAKQRPFTTATRGTRPDKPRPERERARIQRGDDGVVGVARSSAAALGEEDGRQPHALDQFEQAVLLAVSQRALRAGEHRVVVGEHGTGGPFIAEQLAVDPRGACHQAVTGVRAIRSARSRRWRWAAMAKRPYSTNESASTRSAMFSRAVRPCWRACARPRRAAPRPR